LYDGLQTVNNTCCYTVGTEAFEPCLIDLQLITTVYHILLRGS